METVGFLMMSHRTSPEELARQARIMVDAGCECVYVVDSAGALVLTEAQGRVAALVAEVGREAQVGFHGHQNLSLGVANSVLAFESGARQIDGSLCALGAGAGNSPTEVLAATFDHLGVETGVDVGRRPRRGRGGGPAVPADAGRRWTAPRSCRAGRASTRRSCCTPSTLRSGTAWPRTRSSSAPARRGYVGGQEDMMIDIALQLAQERDLGAVGAR